MALLAALVGVRRDPEFWAHLVSNVSDRFCERLSQALCTAVAGDLASEEFLTMLAIEYGHRSKQNAHRQSKRPPESCDITAERPQSNESPMTLRQLPAGRGPQKTLPVLGLPAGCTNQILNLLSYTEKVHTLSFACKPMLFAIQDPDAWKQVVAKSRSEANDLVSRFVSMNGSGFLSVRGFKLVCEVVEAGSTASLGCTDAAGQFILHVPMLLSSWSAAARLPELHGAELTMDSDNMLGMKPFTQSKVSKRVVLIKRGGTSFSEMANHAASGCASGIIVLDNEPWSHPFMIKCGYDEDTPAILAMAITKAKGETLLQHLSYGTVRVKDVVRDPVYFQTYLLSGAMLNARHLDLSLNHFRFSDDSSGSSLRFKIRRLLEETSERISSIEIMAHSEMFPEPEDESTESWRAIIAYMLDLRRRLFWKFPSATLELQDPSSLPSSCAMRLTVSQSVPHRVLTESAAFEENCRRRAEAKSDAEAPDKLSMPEWLLLSENPFMWLAKSRHGNNLMVGKRVYQNGWFSGEFHAYRQLLHRIV